MNPEQQRIAIAEACGWQSITSFGKNVTGVLNQSPNSIREHIPDYLNDLNAMHEAEQSIPEGLTAYWIELVNICGSLIPASVASAQQRAEAFLKTIGKWEGAQP